MASARIRVTIFDHSGEEQCSTHCAAERSQDEVAFITEHLKGRYGETVEVEYIDLATRDDEVRERIKAQNLPLPVVAINGVFKLAGFLEYRAIAEAIEALTEVGGG